MAERTLVRRHWDNQAGHILRYDSTRLHRLDRRDHSSTPSSNYKACRLPDRPAGIVAAELRRTPILQRTDWSGMVEVQFLDCISRKRLLQGAIRNGYTTYRCPRLVVEGSAPQSIDITSRNTASVDEVTLVLAASANPVRREVAYRAAIWRAGNGSHRRERDTNDATSRVVV
jgi:hypothetical protein